MAIPLDSPTPNQVRPASQALATTPDAPVVPLFPRIASDPSEQVEDTPQPVLASTTKSTRAQVPHVQELSVTPAQPSNELPQIEVLTPAITLPEEQSEQPCIITEGDLALLWNAQKWPEGLKLETTAGQQIEIIYRGRWSGGFGPDFKGAIIAFNGALQRGDVELHLKTSGWRSHGHQQDPRYNNVILQVMMEHDSPIATLTEAGTQPPLLALLPLFPNEEGLGQALEQARRSGTLLGSLSESEGPCCERIAEHHPDLEKLLGRIDEMGQQRFQERAEEYEADCAAEPENGPAQALWAGLLEALGYSQNKIPFRRLATAFSFANVLELERTARRRSEPFEERVMTLEAVLLGTAGLLPTQRQIHKPKSDQMPLFTGVERVESLENWAAGDYVEELERRWNWLERQFRATGTFAPLRDRDWTFARLRPPNHPARRLAGLARLVARLPAHDEVELLEWLSGKLDNPTPEEDCRQLVTAFRVGLDDLESESGQFWMRRFDFAPRALMVGDNAKGATADLIGPDRAADMVVNIVLPFLYGYARDKRNAGLEAKSLAAYRVHPKLGTNELVENIARQVFRYWLEKPDELILNGKPLKKLTTGRLIETACRQQGLIHLHHRFCAAQDYSTCPLH